MTHKDKDERDWLAPALDALAEWRFDALEVGSKKDGLQAEIEHLRQQRDELLTALRKVLPVLEFEVETRGSADRLYEIPAGPVLDAVRTAIAKAEGRNDSR